MKMSRLLIVLISWCGLTTLLLFLRKNGQLSERFMKMSKPHADSEITLDDIFISVKTTKKFHPTRLKLVLRTWWNLARDQAYIFTDDDDEQLFNVTGGHAINTKCGNAHDRGGLCCKMGHEYDAFARSGKKWWCHVDDDNYVHVDNLLKVLREYDWKLEYYLGRKSVNTTRRARYLRKPGGNYWFLTGGAGVCISKGLRGRLDEWCINGTFGKICDNLSQPDDTTLGFIINNRLGVNATERLEFNSHIQRIDLIPNAQIPSLATLGFGGWRKKNYIRLDDKQALFDLKEDPSRFLSFHCLSYPNTDWCSEKKISIRT